MRLASSAREHEDFYGSSIAVERLQRLADDGSRSIDLTFASIHWFCLHGAAWRRRGCQQIPFLDRAVFVDDFAGDAPAQRDGNMPAALDGFVIHVQQESWFGGND